MPLNDEQRRAVEYLNGPLLVLAGPGTGKTQLLSAKVAYILEQTDANPENILCLTFTDAGAQNMRDRLQTMIGKAAQDVNIHTYHAFGKDLLDRYRNYTDVMDRKIESTIDETLQYKIIAEIQDKLPAMDILRTGPIKDIISTISNAKSARLSSNDLRKIAEQNIQDSADLSAEISPILEAAPKRCKFDIAVESIYQPILEVLAKYTSPEPIVGHIERIANVLTRELNQLIEKTAAAEKPSVSVLTKWRDKRFEKDGDGKYRLKDYIANKKLLSFSNILQKYDERLQKDGLYDFDDIIEWTIQYLKQDNGFRLSLSELFQYILLDEFQDTNTSQFELIKLLTDYEKPAVMAVGDDDQAIYAFQGANASNLMDFQQHYQAEIISLTQNYRSSGEVLEFSRQIADQINDSFVKSYGNVNKTLTSVQDEVNGRSENSQLARHEFPCPEAEYYWIAQRISELAESGEKLSDIAILAPRHKNLVTVVPYLKARGLNIAYEKRENLLQDENLQALGKLANFVQQLASGKQPAHMLLEILSFEFWGFPTLEAIQVLSEVRNSKNLLEVLSNHETFSPFAQFLADSAAKSTAAPLELMIDYLTGNLALNGYQSPFLSYFQEHCNDAELLEFYESLATLRQLVLSHAHTLHPEQTDFVPKLADFVTTIQDYEKAEAEIMRISNYRDSDEAVQVMTAFKSKGLEFKHVFLTSVDNSAWGKAKGNNNLLALPCNLIQIRHTGISDDEKLRLLFVAITRAKQSLTMTNSQNNSDGKHINRLSYLQEASPEDVAQISTLLPKAAQEITIHHDELDTEQKIETLRTDWVSHYQKQTPAIKEILQARVENFRMTATALTNFIDLVYAGPRAVYAHTILRSPSEPATPSQCYGTLVHYVFEQITNQGIDDETAMEQFRSAVPRTLLDYDDQQKLLEAGLYNIKIALQKFGPILRQDNAKAEVNLSSEHPTLNGIPLTGMLDHIHIDPNNKTIEIYDYKTGKYRQEKWNQHPSLYKYRLQLGFYKLLLNLSPTYRKYQVTRGHILFVTPDDEGQVYDKVYEFDQNEEDELIQLIEKVYQQITSLNFVNDPEIFLPSNTNNGMKQIREFIAKLLEEPADPQ